VFGLAFLSPRLILAAVLALGLAGSHWWAYSNGKDSVYAEVAGQRIQQQADMIEQLDKYRELEQRMEKTKQEALNVALKERAASARVAADLRADADRLRGDLAAFAGAGGAADDSLAACRDRAAALGLLVADGLRVQERIAEGAEACGSDLRAVLAAWPSITTNPP
jgi:hypothetical protein